MSPKVNIMTDLGLTTNEYIVDGKYWSASKLIQWCKEKKYPTFKLLLAGVNLSFMPWSCDSLDDFIWHTKRIKEADLKYPIILDDYGRICDGYHRICKAILENKAEINAIRIETMPKPDRQDEK